MNHVAIITGASEGIGRSMAIAFARQGFRLGLLARRKTLLENVAAECRSLGCPQTEIAAVDITQAEALREALLQLDQRLGGTEIFVANAGIHGDWTSDKDCGEQGHQILALNLDAAVRGLELMKSLMVKRRSGHLVGVSSVAGARGLPGSGFYCASKAALTAYLESLRPGLRPHGIKVSIIAPGFIDTAMTRGNRMWMPFLMPVDRAAAIFVRQVLRHRSLIIAPWQYRPLYWVLRAMPDFMFRWVAEKMA